jgi:hypothetical protein
LITQCASKEYLFIEEGVKTWELVAVGVDRRKMIPLNEVSSTLLIEISIHHTLPSQAQIEEGL